MYYNMKFSNIIMAVFIGLIFSVKVYAFDTTNVRMEQMNDYYKINGVSKANLSYKKYFFIAKIINNSKIYSKSNQQVKIKNELNSSINLSRYLFHNFSSGIKLNYFNLSDEYINYSNDYSKMLVGLSNEFKPNLKYIFDTGYLSENRLKIEDNGYFVKFKILPTSNYNLKPFTNLNYEKTKKRENYKFDNKLIFYTDITNDVKNKIEGKYKVINREYFVDESGNNIEKRLNERYNISNSLTFPLFSNSKMNYDVEYISNNDRHRFVYSDSMVSRTYEKFEFNNKIKLTNNFHKLKTIFYLSNEYKQNNSKATSEGIYLPAGYTFDKKNLEVKSSYQFSNNDSVEIKYYASLLNFDTPDTSNYDDRDELSYSIDMKWRHKFNSFLHFEISGNFYFHHLVYLWHQRSAQNHWNRIFSLRSDLVLNIPDRVTWRSHQEIYTNYFVYDYEDLPSVHINSMIFRGLKLNQSFSYFFDHRYGTNFQFFLRWEDRGFLDWENFYQELTNDKFEYKVSLSGFSKFKKLSVNIGPMYSQRFEYRYDLSNKKYLSFYSYRKGVNLSIKYKSLLEIKYNIQKIKQTNRESYYNNSGFLSIHFVI